MDDLTRFIFHKSYVRADNTVRGEAFLPNPKNDETSVFIISGISDKEIWEIGDTKVAAHRSETLQGRADINENNILNNNLILSRDKPPERHANIIGWPKGKSERKLIALELASKAILKLR